MTETLKKKRGFATMTPEKRREISRTGGKSVPAEKRPFRANKELAREAGQKGGRSVPGERRIFALDAALAREAGKAGGLASGRKRK